MKDELLKKIEDLYDLDKHQEIIDMIEALPAEQLNNELIGQLGRAYNNIQNYEKAIEILKSIEIEEGNTMRWNYRIGYSYYYLDDYENAEKYFLKAHKIDLEDEATLALFRAGNTMGIFQFENPQMRRFLRNHAPSKFDDIVDATSIFRPGPSQFIPQFVARRHGKAIVPVVDDSISEILKPTYGIMIYQEQIMQVAQAFAGFSLGKADLLRRAISKKKGSELEKLREDFLISAGEMGHSKEKAEEIYDLIERFANYGFNRSHGFAYGALAFQIAYFKAHFPDEFYEIQLRDRKREVMILDALDNGFEIEKPNINQMKIGDFVKNKKIRLGLAHVQGISRDLAKWIVENQSYKNLADFVEKLPNNFHKKESILPLIQIGAFDYADSNRGKLAYNLADHANLLNYYSDDIFMASSGGGFGGGFSGGGGGGFGGGGGGGGF